MNKNFNLGKFKERIIKSDENYDLYNAKNLIKRYLIWNRLMVTKKFIDKTNNAKDTSLDFGCQRGFIMTYLCSKYKNVLGIDIDKNALKIAKGILTNEGFSNFKLINNKPNITKLNDLKKGTVDLIVCNDVIFFWVFPKNLEKMDILTICFLLKENC